MKRTKRLIRYIFELIGAIVILVTLGLGVLMWRLDKGPIDMTSSIPELESVLNDVSPGLDFKIGSVRMETNKYYRAIRLRLKGVRIYNVNGDEVGTLNEALLSYNWRNLVKVSPIPVAVRIYGPSIDITRFESGSVGFNLQDEAGQPDKSASVNEVSDFLRGTSRMLRHIRITKANLRYNDLKEDYSIEAKNGLFDFNSRRGEISGTMSVDVKAEEFEQTLQGTISYDPELKLNRVVVGMKDFMLSKIRGLTTRIPPELHVTTPVNILLTADINSELQFTGADFLVTGEKVAFNYAPYYPQDVEMKELLMNAHYAPSEKVFLLKSLYARIEGSELLVKGSLSFDKDLPVDQSPLVFNVQAAVEDVPVDKLKDYWPHEMGHNAREWVVNQIRDGMATSAGIDLQFVLMPDQSVDLKKMEGKIAFKGLTVDYLPPMPDVKNVDGSIVFDAQNFDITTKGGKVFDTDVKKGFVRITDLTGAHQSIEIALTTSGPVKDAIQIISSKPLEYAQRMGMTPDQFSGSGTTDLKLSFPLVMDLRMEQVKMNADATLSNLSVRHIIKDLGITAETLALTIDENHLELKGDALVEGSPAQIEWQEYFSKDAEESTVINAKGTVTAGVLKGLRLPVDGYFSGSALADVQLSQDKDKTTFVTVDADLARAGITVPEFRLEKKPGAAGKLGMKVMADKSGVVTLSDANLSWPQFSLSQGMARINAKGELDSATLKNIRMGRSKADVIVTPKGSATQVVVRGDVIDVSQAWANLRSETSRNPNPRRYDLSLRANKLYLDAEVPFNNIKADLSIRGSDLIRADILGTTDKNGTLDLRQIELKDGSRQLGIKAANAGHVLQALDMSDGVFGGTLSINGKSTPQAPSVIAGVASLTDFTMVKAPIMARLLNAFSPVGLLNLLNNKGLTFKKLQTDFSLPNPRTIRLKNGKMSGDSLGLSFSGYIYRDTGNLSLKGTIVPMEGINKFFGKIPVLGQILTGFKGEGVIGATYTIKGPSSDPNVGVNPLSALTPGIFRSILFEGED